KFGFFELTIATILVIWVAGGYIKMYWPECFDSDYTSQKIKRS
ncbi:MAG: tellurium resistance protein, partial [Vibrio toranzoniae]